MIKETAKIFFLFILVASISACSRDRCKNVTCPGVTLPGVSGVISEECYNGQCLCPDGYEGADCQTYSYVKYQGNYYGNEYCGGVYNNYPSYSCNIFSAAFQNGYGANYIGISSFLGIGTVYGFIENTDPTNLGSTLYIPPQQLSGIYISASYGTYFPTAQGTTGTNRIVINLNYSNLNGNFQCQETLVPY